MTYSPLEERNWHLDATYLAPCASIFSLRTRKISVNDRTCRRAVVAGIGSKAAIFVASRRIEKAEARWRQVLPPMCTSSNEPYFAILLEDPTIDEIKLTRACDLFKEFLTAARISRSFFFFFLQNSRFVIEILI